jgi:hypothetical protein
MNIRIDDIDLHVEVAGDGEPLLWLHGLFGSGADQTHVFGEVPGLWVVPNAGHAPVFGPLAPGFAATSLSFLRGA